MQLRVNPSHIELTALTKQGLLQKQQYYLLRMVFNIHPEDHRQNTHRAPAR